MNAPALAAALLCAIVLGGLPLSAAMAGEPRATVFRPEDFGAAADSDTDAGEPIRKAIAAAIRAGPGAEVVLAAGIYRVHTADPRKRCFWINRAKGLVIRGQPGRTEIIITDPAAGVFSVTRSEGVTIKDLTVDYDPPPFTQGTVVAVDLQNRVFDLDIEAGFPQPSHPAFRDRDERSRRWGMIFDSKRRRLKSGAYDHIFIESETHVKGRIWRLKTIEAHDWRLKWMQPGDRFVYMARRIGPGVVSFWMCKDVAAENLTVHASPSVAVAAVGNENVTVRNLSVRYRPGSHRLLTTDADGVHCQQNRTGPRIEKCYFEGMADDAINIYAPPNVVLAVESPTQLVTTSKCAVRRGDLLQIMNPREGRILAEVRAAEVKRIKRRYRITLERPVPGIQAGKDYKTADTIYNLSACGAGYVVRNNHMKTHRRHGMLLRAGGGLVENNVIEGVAGLGIVVTNEPDWPEGPFARGIIIRNNVIKGVGYAYKYADVPDGGAIQVRGSRLGYRLAKGRVLRQITIENNRFVDPLGAAIYIGAAEDVRIVGNRVEVSSAVPARRKTAAVVLENCNKVTIEDFRIRDPRPQIYAAVEIRDSVEQAKDAVQIKALKVRLSKNAVEVADKRNKEGAK